MFVEDRQNLGIENKDNWRRRILDKMKVRNKALEAERRSPD